MDKYEDITGQRFGRLIVISLCYKTRAGIYWFLRCDCGNTRVISRSNLRRTKSCGCWAKESLSINPRAKTHGLSKTRTFKIWAGMIHRCINSNSANYDLYGGRGIKVCKRWLIFENFLLDMGDPPKGHSLDRIDNSRGYAPANCRWATAVEQHNNKRNNVRITYKGETLSVSQWGKRTGISISTLFGRLRRNWSVPELFNLPKKGRNQYV